jgi:hypothetical protein
MSPLTIPASFGCCISLTPRQLSWLINKNKSPRHPFSFVVLAQLLLRADKETSPPYFARPGEFQNKKKKSCNKVVDSLVDHRHDGERHAALNSQVGFKKKQKTKKTKNQILFYLLSADYLFGSHIISI